MLGRLFSAALRRVLTAPPAERRPAGPPSDDGPSRPMVPLRPAAARSDDGMPRVHEAVEQALREAGYLR